MNCCARKPSSSLKACDGDKDRSTRFEYRRFSTPSETDPNFSKKAPIQALLHVT